MTFLVFAFCFMNALNDWYYATYNENGYYRDAKAQFVTDHILGMLIWWFSIYQLLEAVQQPMQKSKGLMIFSALNVAVILGLFGIMNIVWICRGLFVDPPQGMINGQKWMFWIYICLNIIALVYVKVAAGKGALNHINPDCLSQGKIMLLLILGLLILVSRILFACSNDSFSQYWEATRFCWYLFQMINFLFAVRIANTRHLPTGNTLPQVMQPVASHYHGPVAVVVAGQQQPGIYYPPQQQQPYAYGQYTYVRPGQ